MKFIKHHFLPWFTVTGVIGVFMILAEGEQLKTSTFLIIKSLVLLASIFFSFLTNWTQNTWTPKRRKKLFGQPPLSNLNNLGFVNVKDDYFEGVFKSYQIVISYDHTLARVLTFYVYYQPKSLTRDEFKIIDKLKLGKDINLFQPGLLTHTKQINFKIPTIEKIEKTLNYLVETIEKSGLAPISQKSYDEIIKRTTTHR